MDRSIVFILIFIVVTSVAYYFWQEHQAQQLLAESQVQEIKIPGPSQQEVQKKPEILYPVPQVKTVPLTEESEDTEPVIVAEPVTLPALDDSDAVMQGHFAELYSAADLARIFIFREFIRHVVVTVDNLDGRKLATRYLVTRTPEEKYKVKETAEDEIYLLDTGNAARYRHYIDFIDAVSDQQLVSLYVRYYQLFQQAYEELGYPDRYFNDRLIEIIDHLLLAPGVKRDITLVRPKVYYQFTDSALEDLSAGQKILIRIGNDNAVKIRSRLVSIRQLLTSMRRQ